MFCKRALLFFLLFVSVYAQKSKLMPDYLDHPCNRACVDGGDPMECRYRFVVESYQTMSKACYLCATGNTTDCSRHHCVTANGFSRNIKTVNRGIPGPTIQVCEGDTIVVDLENYFAMAEGVSIHWHGILQKLTPHMDGVGMITQCPVQSSTTFQYRFIAIDGGTHFWHAHTGLQRGEGVFGSLIVRQSPSREPHTGSYDFDLPEHVIMVTEWQNRPLVEVYTAYHHGSGEQAADAILINGRAQDPSGDLQLPRAVFRVEPGQRYRFRVISAGSMFCPITISIDNHNMTLISSDGRAFEPFEVQSFDIYSAERYDFILTTDKTPDNYFLRAKGLAICAENNLEELAIIQYISPDVLREIPADVAANSTRPEMNGVMFNVIPLDRRQPLGDARDQILGMNAVAPDDRALTGDPDHQFILDFDRRMVNDLHYFDPDLYPANSGPYVTRPSAQISKISNRLGPVPLLAQMNEIPEELFCNETTIGEECQTEWCECIHRLTVRHKDLIEMVFISPTDDGGYTHPIHVHGHSFRVVAMDRVEEVISAELFREMDARGDIKRKLSRAPIKDTVAVPDAGYTVVRFEADNPGVWFVHCHLAFHAEIGMSLALQVLGDDGELPPPPPNFPTCGPFEAPRENFRSRQVKAANTPNLQNSDSRFTQQSSLPQTVATPQWLVPLVATMSVVIIALVVVVVQLVFKVNKARRVQRTERGISFPAYLANGERAREDMADGNDHLVYSKKQERVGLTTR